MTTLTEREELQDLFRQLCNQGWSYVTIRDALWVGNKTFNDWWMGRHMPRDPQAILEYLRDLLEHPLPPKKPFPVDLTIGRGNYKDGGCDINPSCLDCPLPQCKYDDPDWSTKTRPYLRSVATLRRLEESPESVTVTDRTIYRMKKRVREAVAAGWESSP